MDTKTRHSQDCRRAFSNYDQTCPRCRELAAGATPRKGWGTVRRDADAAFKRSLDAHFAPNGPHRRGECGPVCTFGD